MARLSFSISGGLWQLPCSRDVSHADVRRCLSSTSALQAAEHSMAATVLIQSSARQSVRRVHTAHNIHYRRTRRWLHLDMVPLHQSVQLLLQVTFPLVPINFHGNCHDNASRYSPFGSRCDATYAPWSDGQVAMVLKEITKLQETISLLLPCQQYLWASSIWHHNSECIRELWR